MHARGLVETLQAVEIGAGREGHRIVARLAQRHAGTHLQSLHQGREVVDVFQLVGRAVPVPFQVALVDPHVGVFPSRLSVRAEKDMLPIMLQVGGIGRCEPHGITLQRHLVSLRHARHGTVVFVPVGLAVVKQLDVAVLVHVQVHAERERAGS